ncbi:MAG: hypothetical protein WKF62_09385 [Solirubrobacterales bacterium]
MSMSSRAAWRFLALVVLVPLLGVEIAGSKAAESFDLGIGKQKDGPFKSSGQDSDPPDSNPQQARRTVEVGTVGKFWVRLKNRTSNDDGVYIKAEGTDFDYQVTYSLNGEDVTGDIAGPGCDQFIVNGNEKLIFKMRVIPTGADPGDVDFFGVKTVKSSCNNPTDAVYARVKVAP